MNAKDIFIIIAVILFIGLILWLINVFTPDVPQANTDSACNDIIDSLGAGNYQPVTIPIPVAGISATMFGMGQGAATGATTPVATANVPIPAATQPSYSPFDKAMYNNNPNNANQLSADTVNTFLSTLSGKLSMYSVFTAPFWNVNNTLSTLTAFFQYQVQVSQVAAAYYTANGTEMINDLHNQLSNTSQGKYFLAQIISQANALPVGY